MRALQRPRANDSWHRLRQIVVAALLLTASVATSAFRSTDFQSFTDPDFQDFQPRKVIVLVNGATNELRSEIERRLVDALARKGVEAVPYRQVFPPTREWSAEEKAEILRRGSFDSGLIVTIGASASQVIPIATQTHGSANVYGTVSGGTYGGNASSSSTTYNVYGARSVSEFSAVLIEGASGRTAWYADITVKAGGTWFVGPKGDAKGLANGIVKGLESDGHITRREPKKQPPATR